MKKQNPEVVRLAKQLLSQEVSAGIAKAPALGVLASHSGYRLITVSNRPPTYLDYMRRARSILRQQGQI